MICPICNNCECETNSEGWVYCQAVYADEERPATVPSVDGYAECYDEMMAYDEILRLNRKYRRYRWRKHHHGHGDNGPYGCVTT